MVLDAQKVRLYNELGGYLAVVVRPTRYGVLFAVLIGLGVGFWQWGRSPRPRVVLENLDREFHGVYFSPDGRTLVTFHRGELGGSDHILTLWNADTGQKRFDLFKGKYPW